MNYELGLLILIFLGQIVLLRGMMGIANVVKAGLDDLDEGMAAAIAAVVENLGVGNLPEPPNPIQQALAQILTNSLSDNQPLAVVTQGPDGKFVGNE